MSLLLVTIVALTYVDLNLSRWHCSHKVTPEVGSR